MTRYIFREIQVEDISQLLDIYNSNTEFLIHHLGRERVDRHWLLKELEDMRISHFRSLGVVDEEQNKLIGHFDFKVAEEAYLSLFILDKSYQNSGLGSRLYRLFEQGILEESHSVRIDVVKGYNHKVKDFWLKQGFTLYEEIDLDWDGNTLKAGIMRKNLVVK